MSTYARILAIDGGGIRGVIPAVLLAEMERRTGKRVFQLFDLLAGTSTGGILSVGLTMRESPASDAPKFRARDLLGLYEDEGKEIFRRTVWQAIRSGGGLADEKYPNAGIESVLRKYFEDAELKNALTEILVTTYDLETRSPHFFKRARARASEDRNYRIRDVARATAAAPTFFEPVQVFPVRGGAPRPLIDGGVFVNNPALCAYAEAIHNRTPSDEILLVSLGTGMPTRPIPFEKAKDWGQLGWARPVMNVMMDGMSDAVDYQLRQLLPPIGGRIRYYRFDVGLKIEPLEEIDRADPENIQGLKEAAESLLADPERARQFDEVCGQLERLATGSGAPS